MENEIKEKIIEDYVNNFIGVMELSKIYGYHRMTIQRLLKKEGIELRKKTPATQVNHFYFSEYNEDNCYWAGFILADGYIRTNKRFSLEIKLQKTDAHHLYKLKESLSFGGKIMEYNDYVSISISSSQIINDLKNNFSIKTKKSLTCEINNQIPKEYLKHFIRGYFDGDGSITFTTTDTINFLGTNKAVNSIRNYFFSECDITLRSKDKPNICKNGNIFTINYSGISAYRCLSEMYKDSKLYLDRKYKLFNKLSMKYYNKIN